MQKKLDDWAGDRFLTPLPLQLKVVGISGAGLSKIRCLFVTQKRLKFCDFGKSQSYVREPANTYGKTL